MFAIPLLFWAFLVFVALIALYPFLKVKGGSKGENQVETLASNHAQTLDRLAAELDLEVETGRFREDDAEQEKRRYERKLLSALKQRQSEIGSGSGAQTRAHDLITVSFVLLSLAIGMVLYVGSFGMPGAKDVPFASREDLELSSDVGGLERVRVQSGGQIPRVIFDSLRAKAEEAQTAKQDRPRGPTAEDFAAAAEMTEEEQAAMITSMVEGLADRAKENPDQLSTWQRLAQVRGVLQDLEGELEARRNIGRLSPDDTSNWKASLRLLISLAPRDDLQRPVLNDEAEQVVVQILRLNENDVEGLFFAGTLAFQAGDKQEAERQWRKTLNLLPQDQPIYAEIKGRIDQMLAE